MNKKIVLTLLAALLFPTMVFANNLWIDEKSKDYKADDAIKEINHAITTRGTADTSEYLLSVRPILTNRNINGRILFFDSGFDPYTKPESFLKHNASGYILQTRGKSYMSMQYVYGAILLEAQNKTSQPLVIDISQSAAQVGEFYGQLFYLDQYNDKQKTVQPYFIVPPNQSKSIFLLRSDAENKSGAWLFPVTPIDFNNIKIEASLKVGDKYVTLSGTGAIPQEIQDKYDMEKQWNADKKGKK